MKLRELIRDRDIIWNITKKYMINNYCLDTMRQVWLAITTHAKKITLT
jgi:hypothetical protein